MDASAGVAGDMLLGALIDAGADLAAVQAAVDAVLPGAVELRTAEVTRAGQRALKLSVEVIATDLPERTWSVIRKLLADAALSDGVRARSSATFGALAAAEAYVHGVPVDEVHFHEVGALDSIADIVGVAAALEDLGVTSLGAGVVAVGSGRIATAHGELPVPVPAVVRLAVGWTIRSGGGGELTTPTGMALLAALGAGEPELPELALTSSGAGAGSRDTPGRPNLTRVLIGTAGEPTALRGEDAVLIEANVDDLDPRLWPGVLDALLRAGAADAWLVPITMKKGRPAHVLSVLARPERTGVLRDLMLSRTSTIGVRERLVTKIALPRGYVEVPVAGFPVSVKISHREDRIWQVTPEFDEVQALADRLGRSPAELLAEAAVSAQALGLTVGATPPHGLRAHRTQAPPVE